MFSFSKLFLNPSDGVKRVPKLSNQQNAFEDFGDVIWDVSVCESVRQRRSMILVKTGFEQLELFLFDLFAYQAYHP